MKLALFACLALTACSHPPKWACTNSTLYIERPGASAVRTYVRAPAHFMTPNPCVPPHHTRY